MKFSGQSEKGPVRKVEKLENGVLVVTSYMPEMHSVAVGVWVRCGLRHEPQRSNGISHFVEHLVFKGTKNRSDQEISRSIEGVGGILNASTGEELTFYYSQVPREKSSLAIDVLLDIVINPLFKGDYLERQRSIVLEEIHMYEDRPSSVVQDMISEVMWGNHPLGRRILGTEESVKATSRKDIREYHKEMYVTGNCVVSVAGAATHEEVVAQVRENTRNMRRGRKARFTRVKNVQRRPKALVRQKETEQTHFCLGMRTFHREHPDRFGLKLISTLLGENMSSRLFQEVREKRGLAYSINTGIDRYLDTGAFVVSAGVVVDRAKEAVTTVVQELKKLKSRPISKAELRRAREYVVGQIEMGMERTTNQMVWAGEDLLLSGRLFSPETIIRDLRAVTPDDIRRIATRIFVESKLNLAAIGPISENKGAVKWLRL